MKNSLKILILKLKQIIKYFIPPIVLIIFNKGKKIIRKFIKKSQEPNQHREYDSKIIYELSLYRLQAKMAFSNPDSVPILKEHRDTKLIVSLTTYPERANEVDVVIYSLLMQSILPDKIILWLSNEEYPNGEKDVPSNILQLKKYGVEIDFCKNIKSYNKFVPTLKKYPNDIIVTTDDDIFYPNNWLHKLYTAYVKNPNYIHAHRAHRITFDAQNNIEKYSNWQDEISFSQTIPSFYNFATGVGGVLYPPNSLHNDIFDEDKFMKLSPNADDVWFWAMALLKGTKINVVEDNISNLIDLGYDRDWRKLWQINVEANHNDKQIEAVINHYQDFKSIGDL